MMITGDEKMWNSLKINGLINVSVNNKSTATEYISNEKT